MDRPRSTFGVKVVDDVVLVMDYGEGMSVTNDAERVVADLARRGLLAGPRRIIYRDSDGAWDELLHRDGVFAGFRALRAPDPVAAVRFA